MSAVGLTESALTLPWYRPGPPDPEPALLPELCSRGMPIYPYPTVEWFESRPTPRTLRTVVAENEYLRLTFTPELNGRLYSLWDKLAEREVLFANPELKPGLVGLRGAWHATGIEVNFPGSHTVTTVDEVPCRAWLDEDGAACFAAWNVEAVSGMAWESLTRLVPGSAAVEMQTRLVNPTDLPHRYYFWMNAAFPVHPGTRYVLPPSSRRIFLERGDHPAELAWMEYPVNDGRDVSVLENLRHASSLFAVTPDEGFFGLHHPTLDTGIAHVADPHLVPGRKVWTWGFAPDGELWHEALTDTGGPYCEVQSGPLRSQLEYRSLAPGQELLQRDVWLPLRGLGGLSWATDQVAAAWTVTGGALELRLLAARPERGAVLRYAGRERRLDLGPEPVALELPAPGPDDTLEVLDRHGHVLAENVRFRVTPRRQPELPQPVAATAWQKARHLEWHGRVRQAEALYVEGAESDSRAAAAVARLALERADAEAAARWSARALALDRRCPDALLTCALAARLTGRRDDELWYREELLGHPAGRVQGLLGLVDLALREGDCRRAAGLAEHLLSELVDVRAYGRLAHALRRLGQAGAALDFGEAAPLRTDPLLAAELYLADPDSGPLTTTAQLAAAGILWRLGDAESALAVLAAESAPTPGTPPAMLACAAALMRDEVTPEGLDWTGFAAGAFAIEVLRHATCCLEGDLDAHYQLGCALAAAGEWEEAGSQWAVAAEVSAEANRNLGLMAWQVRGDRQAAAAFFRHAVAAGGGARTLFEQDLLLAELGRHDERLEPLRSALPRYPGDTRLPQRLAAALVDAGRPAEAIEVLSGTRFQLFEGGAGPQQTWRQAHTALAEAALAAGEPTTAASHFAAATEYPPNLGVGAPATNRACEPWYRRGLALRAAGDESGAAESFARGADPGTPRVFDARPHRELEPEGEDWAVGRGWLRNTLYRALCLGETGGRAAGILEDAERLVRERGAEPALLGWIDRVRAGREPG